MSSVVIRKGTMSDGPKVRQLAFRIMPKYGLTPDPEGLDADLGHFGTEDPKAIVELVAEVDYTVAGSVILKKMTATRAKLSGFYVDPYFRGRGIGKALLQEAIQQAKVAGCQQIYLETWDSMVEAVHLYESFGWVRGEEPPVESGANRSYCLDL